MGIFKKANNIYITVRDTYTSISGSSYEEAEEVIIEATNGDLELVSQKKVIMQGLGNNSDTQETEEQSTEEEKVIDAPCVVHFRPLPSWRGEFGFDWFRDGKDTKYGLKNEGDYKQIIESGYKDGKSDLTKEEAITKMKAEYENFDEYYVPYLTLFSKTFVDELKAKHPTITLPKYKVTLQLIIELEEDIEGLEWKYDNTLVVKEPLLDKSKLKAGNIITQQITITCKDDLGKDTPIEVYAYSKGENKNLVGKLIVLQNNKYVRREEKIVLVTVILSDKNRKGQTIKNNFSKKEKDILYDILYQSFIIPIINEEEIDLSERQEYQPGENTHITPKGFVKYSYKKENVPNEILNVNLFSDTRKLFLDTKNNKGQSMRNKYEKHYTVFMFPIMSNKVLELAGVTQGINIKNSLIFTMDPPNDEINRNRNRDYATLAHEVLHGLGLAHTHREKTPIELQIQKYIYHRFEKEIGVSNIMCYGEKETKYSLHHWQWLLLMKNDKEKCEK